MRSEEAHKMDSRSVGAIYMYKMLTLHKLVPWKQRSWSQANSVND